MLALQARSWPGRARGPFKRHRPVPPASSPRRSPAGRSPDPESPGGMRCHSLRLNRSRQSALRCPRPGRGRYGNVGLQHSLRAEPAPSCWAARGGAAQVLRGWGRRSWGLWGSSAGRCTRLVAGGVQGREEGVSRCAPAGYCPSHACPSPAWGSQSKRKAGDRQEGVKGGSAKIPWQKDRGKTQATRVLSLVGVC